ncbi:hypothetical protein [Marinoscillum sp.]|uniref:hypothetical protein n=1 Tax=Marinoscillum sp. TaxID=2024838 RepID=UPI003BA9A387
MMNEELTVSILSMEATLNECVFIVVDKSDHRVYTREPLIQSVLITAFLSDAQIKLEITPSREIHRVMAFEPQGQYSHSPSSFQYTLTRIATQYSPEDGHRLEAFISGPDGIERQYNLSNIFLQNVIHAAFSIHTITLPETENKIDVSFENGEITKIHIGDELTEFKSR